MIMRRTGYVQLQCALVGAEDSGSHGRHGKQFGNTGAQAGRFLAGAPLDPCCDRVCERDRVAGRQ